MFYTTPHAGTREAARAQMQKPDGIRLVQWENWDRNSTDISRGLDPANLGAILDRANAGHPEDQARLGLEIEEKDWDVAHAAGTRRAAVLGLEWEIRPAEAMAGDATAKRIAEDAGKMLADIPGKASDGDEAGGVHDCLASMLQALLPGYDLQEILWTKGGRGIEGFGPIDARHVTFGQGRVPLLATTNAPMGAPLVPGRFLYHRHRARSGDATRGGLIRPLGWMYSFHTLGIKNLARFAEKFGMPFTLARIDQQSWKADRTKIAQLIRSFGSDGGGVFSKGVEFELLQAANSDGEVYFKLLEYLGDAKAKVILGQTASSGDSAGMSNGDAQSQVRADILRGDCKALARSIREQVLTPWVEFNYGPGKPVPELCFDIEEEEDLQALSTTVVNLTQAGFKPKRDWVADKFAIDLEEDDKVPGGQGGKVTTDAKPPKLPTAEDTLSATEFAARQLTPAQKANIAIADATVAELAKDDRPLRDMLGPLQEAIDEAIAEGGEDPAAFRAALRRLADNIPGLARLMDTRGLEGKLSDAMFAADANGRLEAGDAVTKAVRGVK